jgi:tetratricopeptide (TPR) repeat protein
VRKIWTRVVVCCSIFCVLPGLAFSQEPAQFESLVASAQQAQATGEFQAAAEFYRKAVTVRPDNAELRANLGLMYYQTGKDEQAIAAFRQAIRLKPGLFVPNLFLGLDYVKLKRFDDAIPHLKRAALSNSKDIQAQLGLGQAYTGIGKTRLAISSYERAVQLAPGNADGWFHLGVSYLEQVESDARVLLAQHKESTYVQALMAQTFFEQRALIQAGDAYKKLLALPTFLPDTHANYGFVLLNRHKLPEAELELNAELASSPGSLMARLGLARLHMEQGAVAQCAKEIGEIWKADAGFLRTNAELFNGGLVDSKRSELQSTLEQGKVTGEIPEEVVPLFQSSANAEDLATLSRNPSAVPDHNAPSTKTAASSRGGELHARGRYGECSDLLISRLQLLPAKDLELLASCAYSTGNFRNAFDAGAKLAVSAATEAEGLYWETRSAQRLATQTLAHASHIDSTSPKLHVLLGDVYRQQKYFSDAEQEYRKALALQPEDTGALFGLSLALLANDQIDEAFRLAQAALAKNADDPELNAVMGEILCARNDFSGAEPYLKKSLNTKPELAPHVHALLGKVYAQTDRTQEAITEFKLALGADKDGRIYYQIARLYLKVGDRDSAKQAFDESDRIRRQGLTRAAVAMQQGQDDSESR